MSLRRSTWHLTSLLLAALVATFTFFVWRTSLPVQKPAQALLLIPASASAPKLVPPAPVVPTAVEKAPPVAAPAVFVENPFRPITPQFSSGLGQKAEKPAAHPKHRRMHRRKLPVVQPPMPVSAPPAEAAIVPQEPQPEASPEPDLPRVRLSGVISGDGAVAVVDTERGNQLIAVGDQVGGTMKLESVSETGATFRMGDKKITLSVGTSLGKDPLPDSSAAVALPTTADDAPQATAATLPGAAEKGAGVPSQGERVEPSAHPDPK